MAQSVHLEQSRIYPLSVERALGRRAVDPRPRGLRRRAHLGPGGPPRVVGRRPGDAVFARFWRGYARRATERLEALLPV